MKPTPPRLQHCRSRTTYPRPTTNDLRPWYIYILRCADSTLYTGISTDVEKRIANHNAKKGASYTKSRGPVVLVFKEGPITESAARKCEWAIKQLTREEKELFIKERQSSSQAR